MGRSTIPVDLLNPGQVFACLGLGEVAEVLFGDARAAFDWHDASATVFHLEVPGEVEPIAAVLAFLSRASVHAVTPPASSYDFSKWPLPVVEVDAGGPFPISAPSSPATLPAGLSDGHHTIRLDHWGDTERDNVKFWAGSGGYPGVALLRDALDVARPLIEAGAARDPFSAFARQSSSFRFDWRRDYVPLQIGFSLNAHTGIAPRGYPLVEILAAIGLSHARPLRPDPRDKLAYRYGVVTATTDRLLPLALHRVALGCTATPFPMRTFRMALDWPGQENQARCITTVSEELSP